MILTRCSRKIVEYYEKSVNSVPITDFGYPDYALWLLGFSCRCMFYSSLFVLLSFFFWPLCCLSFFDLRILINPFGIFKLFKIIWLSNLLTIIVPSYLMKVIPETHHVHKLYKSNKIKI